ncbi:MAG: terpene cyclase/mutase family protein, partial [Armatimonadetes bacterium]|nr:terpene cyclase/mutase family protein [Armatimonadota bacterium]
AVVRALKAAQRPDGGFSAVGDTSDLATTYRVMRAFWMLKEKPHLGRLREFISRCRNADGGYGPSPGQPSTASTTYFAAIVLHWIDQLQE